MSKIEGGCLCGKVRYASDAEPALQVICHCKTCQRNSGSAFSTNIAIPSDSLRIEQGSPKSYEDHSGASGKPFQRHFCPDCGSYVYSGGPAYGDLSFIKVGTLDDSDWVQPDMHIWCAEKMTCSEIPAQAKQFDGNPH